MLLRPRLAVFALTVALAVLASTLGLLSGPVAASLLIAAIAVAVWHGAYDHVQAQPLIKPWLGRFWLLYFVAGYLALAGLTLVGWWLFPFYSLLLFLFYSAWHFGTEAEQGIPSLATAITATALGSVPIVAAAYWHPAFVTHIFSLMLGGGARAEAHAAMLASALALAFGCWPLTGLAAVGAIAGLFGGERDQRLGLLVLIGLQMVLFMACGSFFAFAVYFCVWHSPEHLVSTSTAPGLGGLGGQMRANLRAGVWPWLASLAGLALLFWAGRQDMAAYQAEIFIALSVVLTVPHMALNELRSRSGLA